jgi:hypothetical protein
VDTSLYQIRKESLCLTKATIGSTIRDKTKEEVGGGRLVSLRDDVAAFIVGLKLRSAR